MVPSSRSPWKLVNSASRNTPALVRAPVVFPTTAVRMTTSTASPARRFLRASIQRAITCTP